MTQNKTKNVLSAKEKMAKILQKRLATFQATAEDMFLHRQSSISIMDILCELTEGVNYGCNFDNNGVCKRYSYDKLDDKIRMCCCKECFSCFGYLGSDSYTNIRSQEQIDTARSLFGEKGFWSPEGCLLPRKYRSSVCLGYSCKSLTRREATLILAIRNPFLAIAAFDSYRQRMKWPNLHRNARGFVRTLTLQKNPYSYMLGFAKYRMEGCNEHPYKEMQECSVCNELLTTKEIAKTTKKFPKIIEKGDQNAKSLTVGEKLIYEGRVHADCIETIIRISQ